MSAAPFAAVRYVSLSAQRQLTRLPPFHCLSLLQARAFSSSSALLTYVTVFVKQEGGASFVKVRLPLHSSDGLTDVADLTEEAVKKLSSLQGKDLSTITLHLQTSKTVDGKVTTELGPALDSKLKLEKAGLLDGADIIVKVASSGGTAGEVLSKRKYVK